jgi:RNA polymerase sigma-70 factor (ECF subfamily)
MANDNQSSAAQQRADEFTALYAAHERGLFAYIVTVIGNPTDAYDVLQDTNLVLWQKFDQFKRGTNFFAWAREVARYRTLQHRRLHATDTPALGQHALDAITHRLDEIEDYRAQPQSEEQPLSEGELLSEELPKCVAKLSAGDRELIELRYGEDVPVRVLAKKFNRTANAISQSLGRIRRLLRKCVEEAVRRRSDLSEPPIVHEPTIQEPTIQEPANQEPANQEPANQDGSSP